ncbi:hypothetical protein LSAT2_017068 [Lamellibrachia satsuma]|nr:hypothetical protein LSAT2_017068 [Lamellibrachia satsuma]
MRAGGGEELHHLTLDVITGTGAVHIDVVRVRGHVMGGTAVAPLAAVDVTSTDISSRMSAVAVSSLPH